MSKRRWETINESIDMLQGNMESYVSDMSEMEADIAISEALALGGESKYIIADIMESVKSFNTMADNKGFGNFEYLSEAVGGGFFKKIWDVLVRFWTTIVNYIKAMFSKFTSSGDIEKRMKDLEALCEVLKVKKFKKDAKFSYKKYAIAQGSKVTSLLLDPNLYIGTPLKEGDVESTLTKITAEAIVIAADYNEILKTGKSVDAKDTTETIDKTVKGLEDITKDLGFGDKASVKVLVKLLEKSNGYAGIKKLMEDDVKAKDAKSLTVLLKDILMQVFKSDAPTVDAEGDAIVTIVSEIETAIKGFGGFAGDNTNKAATMQDRFEEGRKRAQDVLDKLKESANKIDNYSKTAQGNVTNRDISTTAGINGETEDKDSDKTIEKSAESAGKLSTALSVIQVAMQEALTKGMDAGLTLLKAMLKELEYRAKAIDKLPTEAREKTA